MTLAGRLPRRGLLGFAAAIAVAMACSALPASAHTTHEGSQTLFKGSSGSYDLLVTAVPLVGFLEITVAFEPDEPDAPLPYIPRVVVLASRDAERLGPVAASRSSSSASEYIALLEPQEQGAWEITINIDGEPGSATLTLPVQVRESGRGFPWLALAAGLGILLPILWLVFAPRRRRGRDASPSG